MSESLHLAYADPPYEGQASRHYDCGEIDHRVLIGSLAEHYDGWALSCKTNSLRYLLPLCPESVRVCAWVKPYATPKKGVWPMYAWEPVVLETARTIPHSERERDRYDWVRCPPEFKGFTGQKPRDFLLWLFQVMGARECDTLDNLFPGSGAVDEVWEQFKRQSELF